MWKPIPGWEGYYSASEDGKIRSEARTITRKEGGRGSIVNYKERLMSLCKNRSGYLTFPAMRDGNRKTIDAHRAVFEAHIRPLLPGEQVDHIDSNKINNHISNLQGLTEYDHKCLTQQRIRKKCKFADAIITQFKIVNSLWLFT